MTRTASRVTRRKRIETEKRASRVKANSHHKMPRKPTSPNGLKKRQGFKSYQELLAAQISSIPGVDAVFIYADNDGPVHVYSVVEDYSVEIYKKLLNCDRKIEKELPGMRLDFHVRAHHSKKPARVIPLGARPAIVG